MPRLSPAEAKTAVAYLFDAFDANGNEVIEDNELARVKPMHRKEVERLVTETEHASLDQSFHSRDVPPEFVAGFAVAGTVAAASIACLIASIFLGFGVLGIIAFCALALSSASSALLGVDLGRNRKDLPTKEKRRDDVIRDVVDLMRADARSHTQAALSAPKPTGVRRQA